MLASQLLREAPEQFVQVFPVFNAASKKKNEESKNWFSPPGGNQCLYPDTKPNLAAEDNVSRGPWSSHFVIKESVRSEEAVRDLSWLTRGLTAICIPELVHCRAPTGHLQDKRGWRELDLGPAAP